MADETVDVAVLMPVHAGVVPDDLRVALASVAAQTARPREVVVVVDGPVPSEVEEVLGGTPGLRLVRLPTNQGAGPALAAGLAVCGSTWVARADSDDVNEPARLETQLAVLESSGADVCAAAMTEFTVSPDQVVGVRRTPLAHREFARLLPSRNPVNHPTVVFRRTLAESAGGYQDLPYLEDYDLWARLLAAGAVFVGCREPLVRFRVDGLSERRSRPEVLVSERLLQPRLRGYGLVGPVRSRWNLLRRTTYLRLPPALQEAAYGLIFRRRG